jgi:hypothetical protein
MAMKDIIWVRVSGGRSTNWIKVKNPASPAMLRAEVGYLRELDHAGSCSGRGQVKPCLTHCGL